MRRRDALAALGSLPLAAACSRPGPSSVPGRARMPVVFAAHGAPTLLDDAGWVGELAAWSRAMPRPRAILMVSAHWEARPTTLGATRPVPLVYDFYGFPDRYYRTT
jgi:4,5-DOPA dioxygenase extradiol